MGCDIHMYVEKKRNGKWMNAQSVLKLYEDSPPDVPHSDSFYSDRNYEVFGFIAGVRREDLQYFEAKGFPKDACAEVKALYEDWGCDAHTPSYLTLGELQEAQTNCKERTIKESGMMDKKQWAMMQKEIKKKEPNWSKRFPYCAETTCENYVPFELNVPIAEVFKLDKWTWKLKGYDFSCGDAELRIVFWFDN